MELINALEHLLTHFVALLELGLETISAFCVLIGVIKTGQLAIALSRSPFYRHRSQKVTMVLLRLRFGVWLAIALEFQLGADIVATTIAPSFESLGKLGAIAAVRTFLNYFLNRELNQEFEEERKIGQDLASSD